MASAELGASFNNSPHPLYIKDTGGYYEGSSPPAKFYSSRPELDQDNGGEENLRTNSMIQK